VAAETEHHVEFIESYGGKVVGVAETLEAVQQGTIDIGAFCVCFEPAKLFLHNFPYYAPFGPASSNDAIRAARLVYDKHPWLLQVLERDYGQLLLGLGAWDNYHLGTRMEWKSVDDLRGVRIAGAGPNLPWLEYAGAVPVQSTLPEGYLALKTGVYEGWLMTPAGYAGYKFYEPSPYYTLIGFGAMPVILMTVNAAKLSALPEDVRRIIVETGQYWEKRNGVAMDELQASGLESLRANGAQIRVLPPMTRRAWAFSLARFPAEQEREAERRSMPGNAVLQAYIEAAEAGGHRWPVRYVLDRPW
jgi:TRAP-type C4-dicarboxylate transport system substrate-binding protein